MIDGSQVSLVPLNRSRVTSIGSSLIVNRCFAIAVTTLI